MVFGTAVVKERFMAKMPRGVLVLLAGVALATVLGARPAAAQCVGDCNGNNAVGSADLTQIVMLINLCPNTNGCITAGELTEAISLSLSGCPAGNTPTPTNTTQVPPTVTATTVPTNTATAIIFTPTLPPAATATFTPTTALTATPTNTVPAATATPTNTPTALAPTVTPTSTPTATSVPPTSPPASPVTIKVGLLPGGGSPNSCRGTCQGGLTPGAACGTSNECLRVCASGPDQGKVCAAEGDCRGAAANKCPAAPCVNRACAGGLLNGTTCTSAANCNGCTLVPPQGSCAVVQNPLFPVVVPLNGVCVDAGGRRSGVAGDVSCTTNAECKVCVGGANAGKVCRPTTGTINDCATGTCSAAATCKLGGFDLEIGATDGASGEAPLMVPQDSLVLSPAVVPGIGTVCVTAGGAATGAIDCDGGRANLNTLAERDHNTVPGNAGNYGQRCKNGPNNGLPCTSQADCPGDGAPGVAAYCAGLPDDPQCDDTTPQPDGSVSRACVEGTRRCIGGANDGQLCRGFSSECRSPSACVGIGGVAPFKCFGGPDDGVSCTPQTLECPGGACTPCNTGTGDGPHPGICNSPTYVTQTGTFGTGDIGLGFPLALGVYGSSCPGGVPAGCFGPDGLACTADDIPPSPPSPVTVALSTGVNQVYVMDASNLGDGAAISPDTLCPGNPCIAQLTGVPIASCSALRAGDINGVIFGGGFPAFDTTAGDIATTFRFALEKRN